MQGRKETLRNQACKIVNTLLYTLFYPKIVHKNRSQFLQRITVVTR